MIEANYQWREGNEIYSDGDFVKVKYFEYVGGVKVTKEIQGFLSVTSRVIFVDQTVIPVGAVVSLERVEG